MTGMALSLSPVAALGTVKGTLGAAKALGSLILPLMEGMKMTGLQVSGGLFISQPSFMVLRS